jgi:hypothetical protein
MLRVGGRATERARVPVAGTARACGMGMDWSAMDVERLADMRCPSCRGTLGGGLMRQVEWSARRCVVVVSCPGCGAESMAILEDRAGRHARAPIDVDDVRRAHDLLTAHDWRVSELFAA